MSELTKKYCIEQIKRLAGKPFFSAMPEEGKTELARTLFEGAKSPEHAERIITRACRTNFGREGEGRCPDANEIWALCRTVPADRKLDIDAMDFKPATNEPCDLCAGHVGFIVLEIGDVTAARKCPCGAVPSLSVQFPTREVESPAIAALAAAKVGK